MMPAATTPPIARPNAGVIIALAPLSALVVVATLALAFLLLDTVGLVAAHPPLVPDRTLVEVA